MDFASQIAPFTWDDFEGSVSVTMYTSHKYKAGLFKTRKKEGFDGSGYDWESLAQVFLQEKASDLLEKIDFDSEHLCFVAYSTDKEAMKRFVLMFKEMCENDVLLADIFSRTTPQEPVTEADMKSILERGK
ncbi:MAG: immunity 51 family protein [Defluviitaleaceae bacterium]|nr:immunity 51 family protein [Defluviitaleaceae bacterium]MCL2189760.1 immunity 51 family protein [Defluviitaleaceae bacterium]MCL2275392.1 immunity 51 family protein [Defluviitaleaceae bacterium]